MKNREEGNVHAIVYHKIEQMDIFYITYKALDPWKKRLKLRARPYIEPDKNKQRHQQDLRGRCGRKLSRKNKRS